LDEQLTLKECLHDPIKSFFLIILLLSKYNNLIMKILTNICSIIIIYSKSTIFNPINLVSVLLTGNTLVSYIDWYLALPYSVLYFQKKGAWTCSSTSSFVHEHFGIIRPH